MRFIAPVSLHSRRTRALVLWASIASVALAIAPVSASAAAPLIGAVRSAPIDVTYQAGSAVGSRTTSYGATLPIERRIPIGASSTQISFSHPLTVKFDRVQCVFRESSSTTGAVYKIFTGAEWAAPGTRTFDIPAGFVVAASNRVYRFECRSGIRVLDLVAWSLKERSDAPTVVNLGVDPAKLTSTAVFTERLGDPTASPRSVHEGDRIVVKGEPNAFPKSSDSPTITGTIQPRSIDGAPIGAAVSLTNLSVNADGSRMSGVIPSGLGNVYFGNDLATKFSVKTKTMMTDTTPGRSRDVQWSTTVIAERVVPAASSTNIKLHDSTVATTTAAKLAVRVSTPSVIPSGTIETFVDGIKVATTTLWSKGTATVTLPAQGVGDHAVSVRYLGNSTVAPSTSQTVTLTVSR